MRTVEIGLASMFFLSGFLVVQRSRRRRSLSHSGMQVLVGCAIGVVGAVLVLSARIDLVPDHLERPVVAVIAVGIAAQLYGLLWYRGASKP